MSTTTARAVADTSRMDGTTAVSLRPGTVHLTLIVRDMRCAVTKLSWSIQHSPRGSDASSYGTVPVFPVTAEEP